jgi:hypothetical protein
MKVFFKRGGTAAMSPAADEKIGLELLGASEPESFPLSRVTDLVPHDCRR